MSKAVGLLLTLLALQALVGAAAPAQGVTPAPGDAPAPASSAGIDTAQLSYALGYQIGSRFAAGRPKVDMVILRKAIDDAYAQRRPSVSMRDMHWQLHLLQQHMHTEALTEFREIAAQNAQKSRAYLEANAKRPGVVHLPSGIEYSVLKKGTGTVKPAVNSRVTVNYRGMLIDGTEFDSTWAHGAPVSFTVDKVIPGWQDVIPRMRVGDRWKVVIPPQLAYGEEGALPRIGPNEALVFEIELLAINPDSK
ncbi:MAG: FKBP-type peptidyl-prolyl cis-trans isomerase [Xanthomonadales bacterium]|nr:FKBP-type peptidyl-prolyl cis-trans isomerase [Xanthomonadales bacterium]